MLPMVGHTMGTSSVILYALHTMPGRIAPHNHCACTMYKCFTLYLTCALLWASTRVLSMRTNVFVRYVA